MILASHYKQTDLEPIDAIEKWELNFALGNVVKYIVRHEYKGGVDDLKKALWYLQREIERQTREGA